MIYSRTACHAVFILLAIMSATGLGTASAELHRATKGSPQPVFEVSFVPSQNTKDEELLLATVLPDRLVPMTGDKIEGENAALAAAVKTFLARFDHQDVSALRAFVEAYPASRWNASLLLNIGLLRYETGYLSEALSCWEAAWTLSKNETKLGKKAIADRAISEAILLDARLGRLDAMRLKFTELGSRPLTGSAATNVESAKEGMFRMIGDPGVAFKCGPYALNSILNHQSQQPHNRHPEIEKAQSTPQGTSLLMVRDWALQVGLNYQMARRAPSAQLIFPAVMHWKLDHFAALLAYKDGRYLVQDATFAGAEMWITAEALNAETDGYFLVPAGDLPAGWSPVSDEDGANVWGKGGAAGRDKNQRTCPKGGDCEGGSGMPYASYYLMQADVNIQDTPLEYQPPIGPAVSFHANYNQDETGTPEINTHSHLGANWDFNWVSYLEVNPSHTVTVRLRYGGTETYQFSQFNNVTGAYAPNMYTQAVLKWRTDDLGRDIYFREMPDGSKEEYSQAGQPGTIGRYYLKKVIDPQGHAVTINYEVYTGSTIVYSDPPLPTENVNPNVSNPKWTGRINQILDAAGGVSFVTYLSNNPNHTGFRKIKKIFDPYGRTVEFTYDGTLAQPDKIKSITDAVGMVSSFSYAPNGFMELMTTPYGKTHFRRYNQAGSFEYVDPNDPQDPEEITADDFMKGLMITYPNGSTSVVESWIGHHPASYHWNRLAMSRHPLDVIQGDRSKYEHAEIYFWNTNSETNEVSSSVHSFKQSLAGETTYNYPGATSHEGHDFSGSSNLPLSVASPTGTSYFEYNALGNITSYIDPVFRKTRYYYDGNGMDLREVRQANAGKEDLLFKAEYDHRHLPVKIFDASGHATLISYNQYGQIETITDALGHVTTYQYFLPPGGTGSDSLLQTINGPLPGNEDIITYTYDVANRLESVTDPEGYKVSYEYDNLNRIEKTIYQPSGVALADAEYEEVIWDRLNPIVFRDRKGRLIQRQYDEMKNLVSETDGEGRTTKLEWCTCGSLSKLVDGNNNVTRWDYDDAGRLQKKTRDNGRKEEYTYYPNQSRLQHLTTAGDVRQQFSYFADGRVSAIDYYARQKDGEGQPVSVNGEPVFDLDPKTPSVRYSYDQFHPRLVSINDAENTPTISYDYHPYRSNAQAPVSYGAGALSRVNEHAFDAAIVYDYDALERLLQRFIYSVVDGELIDDNHYVVMNYDAIGRVTEMWDHLGTFTYQYDQPLKGLSRLSKVIYPNGQESSYSWLPASQHHRLEKITHRTSNEDLISEYGYGYTPEGQLNNWSQKVGTNPEQQWSVEHDDADQLRSVVVREGSSILKQQFYNYDKGGNRVSYQEDNSVMKFGFNSMNQIISRPAGGLVRFEGVMNEAGTTSVNGQSAEMRTVLDDLGDPEFRFGVEVQLAVGVNNVLVTGLDGSGNQTQQEYEVEVQGIAGQAVPEYDIRGNMTNNGRGQEYEWDALNQLLAIKYADESRTEFGYDAMKRRVREVEKNSSGMITTDKRLLWVGYNLMQERYAEGTVTKRYGTLGLALADDTKYYYSHDHLNSVRQVVDENNILLESYTYDSYGVSTASPAGGPGNIRLADFRYTGHRYHEKSGLHLAPFRAYDASLGVWISEDPIEESGGINLHAYVSNSPLLQIDPTGENPVAIAIIAIFLGADYINAPGPNDPTYGGDPAGLKTIMACGGGTGARAARAAIPHLAPGRSGEVGGKPAFPRIRGSRGGTTDKNKVRQIADDMKAGRYMFKEPRGQIGGYKNCRGEYQITEGHHRMQGAMTAAKETGDKSFIHKLLENGRWDQVKEFPNPPTPLPPVK